MANIVQDFRYALRLLALKPGFAAAAVLTLSLGIGANTAVFSFMNALFLRPLPGRDADRIVRMYQATPRGSFSAFSYPNYTDIRDRNRSFSDLAVHQYATASLNGGAGNSDVQGEVVSGNYFAVMGVPAALGRALTPEDDRDIGAHPVVVLSDGLWKRSFGGDADVVGSDIRLNGNSFTVIGVAPDWFSGSYESLPADFWTPVAMYEQVRPRGIPLMTRGWGWLDGSGRLARGVSFEQAVAELSALSAQLEEENPRMNSGVTFELFAATALPERMRDGVAGVLGFLMLVVSLVLLAACANIASILLVRATTRGKETAIRQALGAGRWRLTRQWLTESFVLSLLGGLAGLIVAMWVGAGMLRLVPPNLGNFVPDLSLDLRVLGFALAATVLTGVLFGLFPALRSARLDLVSFLKGEGISPAGFVRRSRLHGSFVVGQVTVSLVLLILAGLLLRSLGAAGDFEPGFDASNVVVSAIDLRRNGYETQAAGHFYQQLFERLNVLPGARSAAFSSSVPFGGGSDRQQFQIAGHEPPEGQQGFAIGFNMVTPGYFQTMGIDLRRGRDFERSDGAPGARGVIVINETMSARYWGAENPVGRFIALTGGPELEIVGVVADSNYLSLGEDPVPFVFSALGGPASPMSLNVLVRSEGDPTAMIPVLRRSVEALDPNVGITDPVTYEQLRERPLFANRAMAMASTSFGLLALALAAIGIYGIVSYAVLQRTHEIGIRMALGAHRLDIFRMILGQGMFYTGVGLVLGLAAAAGSTRLVASLLFGVGSRDPLTFAAITALLLVVSLTAIYMPAYRATRVDPMHSLRHE